MQRTRINLILSSSTIKLNQALINPWRRISLSLISLFFGVVMGQALTTTAGQTAIWDITSAGLMLLFTEAVSWYFYRRKTQKNSFGLIILNIFKIGLTYSFFLEAFKVGS